MSKLLKIVLCWVLICSGCAAPVLNKDNLLLDRVSQNPSVELQLLDIYLGMPYEKAKALLTQKYGKPIRFQSTPPTTVTFKLGQKTNNVIEVTAKSDDPSAVGDVAVVGTEPIPGLNFFSNANLGDSEKNIHFKFPKAEMEQRKEYRQYIVPFTNYFLDVKNGKVTTLGIWDRFTLSVKGENDSIDLSPNLAIIAWGKGWLSNHKNSNPKDMEKIKTLAFDSLRPYCKERYPLRQAPLIGKAYVDVNVFKNKQDPPIPATFLLDTGWFVTSISREICKKVNCKYAKPTPSERDKKFPDEKAISVGSIEIGTTRDTMGLLTLMPPKTSTRKKDGVLGISTLAASPLFINFKQGYLCFPALPVSQVVQKLKFAVVSPERGTLLFWTNYYANNQKLNFGHIDSGADVTFLSKENIKRLKLRDLHEEGGYFGVSGWSQANHYGPVEIGWPSLGITQKLRRIVESDGVWSLIGMDFLRHYILGIDFETNFSGFYIGE